MSRVEAPVVEVRHFVDGSVEAIFRTPYGEAIAELRVTDRRGHNDEFAEHAVTFMTRDESDLSETCMIGAECRVKVPLASGEQEAVRLSVRRAG